MWLRANNCCKGAVACLYEEAGIAGIMFCHQTGGPISAYNRDFTNQDNSFMHALLYTFFAPHIRRHCQILRCPKRPVPAGTCFSSRGDDEYDVPWASRLTPRQVPRGFRQLPPWSVAWGTRLTPLDMCECDDEPVKTPH